jgi:hypothetical protein
MEWLFKWRDRQVKRATAEYLNTLRRALQQDDEAGSLQRLRALPQRVSLGRTLNGKPVELPVGHLTNFSVTTGSQGSGKTMFVLLLIAAMLRSGRPFGLVDAKGDLFDRALYLISQFPEVWDRVVINDFNNRDVVSPYNILVPQGDDLDYFLTRRLETIRELLPARDQLSLRGTDLLRHVVALLAELRLPVTLIERVLTDARLRARLLRACQKSETKWYFRKIFPTESQATIGAVRARVSALFASESLRLSLGGSAAPDFRLLQDEGKIVLVNCAGPRITRGMRLFLLALVLSDIRQSIFARVVRNPYLWFMDEAQNLFRTPSQREDAAEILNTGRSFFTFVHFITQHLETAISERDILSILHQNLTWSFTLRSDPKDCSFLQRALPVSGRRPKPSRPFQEPEFLTREEERRFLFERIAHLPDRTGYLFLKAHTPEAILLKTNTLEIGEDFEQVVREMKGTPEFGGRMQRPRDAGREVDEDAGDVFARMEEDFPDSHE